MESALNRTREVVGERQRIRRLAVETPGDVLAKLGSGSKADHRIVTIKELSGPSDDPESLMSCEVPRPPALRSE